MARKSELLYWTGSRWANAKFRHWDVGESPDAWMDNYESDGTDSNPVMSLRLEEKIGNPRSAVLTISNTPRNASSAAANEKKGRFTGVFTDFQNVRLRDGDTGTILFAGKIYNMQEKYDVVLGNIIVLTLRDNLEELKNYKIGTWVDNPLAYTTGSRVSSDIATIIDNVAYLDSDSISFSNTDKYEASATQYDQAGNIEFPGNSTVLKAVSNLAKKDPHEDGATDDFGYDYLVDPAVVTSATDTAAPSADWNYFKRGTRPSTAPETYGLSIKYPKPSNFAKDGYNTRMMNDFDFEEPKGEIYSDVVLTYRDMHLQLEGGVEATDGSQGAADRVVTKRFERIDVTFTNDGAFTGATYPIGQGELLTFTPDGGGAAQFAKFEYQSVIRSGTNVTGFIIVSPLIASPSFNANFPEAVGTITGVTSGKTATTTATCRVAKNFGVRKSKAVKSVDTLDPQKIRQEIASYLSRNTTVIKRGAYKVANYPYHYIDAQASKVSRSNGTVSFTTGAFATNGGSATNNPELFGVHVGDVIVELDATATTITRYAYISSTGSSSVVYGGDTATQTSDGTALDATKPMRIYIPLRPGHIAQVTNSLVDVSGTHLVTYLNYEEKDGVSFTEIASVGKNDSAALKPNIFDTLVDGVESYGDTDPTKGTNIANVKSWTFTGTATATDSDTVAWTAGKLYDDTGAILYSISSGDTGNMSAESIVYFDVVANSAIFSTSTKATYVEKVNRVKILAASNSSTAAGSQATFSYLTPVSGFSTTGAQLLSAADAIVDNSLTATLAKKGVQQWSSNLSFEATGTAGDYNKIKFGLKGTIGNNANVQFADGTDETVLSSKNISNATNIGSGASITVTTSSTAGVVTFTTTGTIYLYKSVGDSESTTIKATDDYSDVYADDAILLCTVSVPSSDDDSDSPSIFPFTANEATISAGVLAANSITADVIQAGVVAADFLSANVTLTNKLFAGAGTFDSNLYGVALGTLGSNRSFVAQTNGTTQVEILSSGTNAGLLTAGGGNVIIGANGVEIKQAAAEGTSRLFLSSANIHTFEDRGYTQGGSTGQSASRGDMAGAMSVASTSSDTLNFFSPSTLTAGATDFSFSRRNSANLANDGGSGSNEVTYLEVGKLKVNFGNSTYNDDVELLFSTTADSEVTFTHNRGNAAIANGGKLDLDGFTGLTFATAVTSGNVETGAYGTFRYATDGGGGSADVLAFLSGQGNATPAAATGESAFWTMLSEDDGASGSRLIFEPIVDYGTSAGSDNHAWIGYHNTLVGIQSYYMYVGDGTNSFPGIAWQGDSNTGFYRISSGKVGYSSDGTNEFYFDTGIYPATDSSGGTAGESLGAGSQAWHAIHGYTLYMYNSVSTTGTDLIVTGAGQIAKKSSSIQYKDNVKELVFDSSKLDSLRPVSYDYKFDNAPDIGLIAEEVNEVYPELINYDKHGKAESIKYHSLSVMLLDEVNKLRKEVKILKEKS